MSFLKIATVTCQHAHNYGATLQAYALQAYLEGLGHEVKIIQFIPWYFHNYEFGFVDRRSKYYHFLKRHSVLRFFYCARFNRFVLRTRNRIKAFDDFDRQYLHLTNEVYPSSDSLIANPVDADVYIAGSDQIWNTDMQNGHEDAYYLNFGSDKTKRISYAASFGIQTLPNQYKDFVRQRLSRFNHISVREQSALNILSDLGVESAVHVCDPVFLLSPDEWRLLAKKSRSYDFGGDYLLLYDFVGDKHIKSFIKSLAQKRQLKIVSINDHNNNWYADYNVNNAGPLEFLSLVDNASVVVCNSFHATAFSILFQTEFYSFPISNQRTSSRIFELLKSLSLSAHFNPNEVPSESSTLVVDHLEEVAQSGKKFLNDCLS